jgi:hypothetical protein
LDQLFRIAAKGEDFGDQVLCPEASFESFIQIVLCFRMPVYLGGGYSYVAA